MTRLNWGAAGERFFETGVDHGVLFVGNSPGVPWSGLVSVNEAPSGADVTPYYIDGVKYLNDQASEEFEATIEAYTYPDEFEQCDGTIPVMNGLSGTQQKRKPFGLSYRTKVGNDVEGLKHGYKIHLVYNATAQPSPRTNKSLGDTIEPNNFSWAITTIPAAFKGFRPLSHFVVDSRDTPREVLLRLEEILYGSDTETSRLPVVEELRYVFESYNASVFDAGSPIEPHYGIFDGGVVPELQTSIVDGGAP